MNLQNEIAEELSAGLCSDIDFAILSDILIKDCDWIKVVLTPMTTEVSSEIDQWLENHCQGQYLNRGLVWIFEQAKDANWFALRWI